MWKRRLETGGPQFSFWSLVTGVPLTCCSALFTMLLCGPSCGRGSSHHISTSGHERGMADSIGLFHFFPQFLNYFIVVRLQLSAFSPHPSTPAKPTCLPCFHPPPWFCPCVLYSSSCKPLSPLSLPHSPLAIVRLFLTQCLWFE